MRQDFWVSPASGLTQREDGLWSIAKETFDTVVIAHNGKCAERLTSNIRANKVKDLLRADICAPRLSVSLSRWKTRDAANIRRRAKFGSFPVKHMMTLNSIYSLLVELPTSCARLPAGMDAARVDDSSVLAFAGCNGAKLNWPDAGRDSRRRVC